MCGILYAVNFDGTPVNKTIIHRYLYQRNRGKEGYGIYDRQQNNLVRHTKEVGIMRYLKRNPSSDILFHHRLPTSTINIKNACHPFSTRQAFKTNYILIHNGWINNADTLFTEHMNEGLPYTSLQPDWSFNDSESLLYDMALYLEGKLIAPHSRGAVAFVMIARNAKKGDKLYFYRNYQSPLKYSYDGNSLVLASEGAGEDVPENYLFCFDYASRALTFQKLDLPTAYSYSGYGYPDWGQKSDTTKKVTSGYLDNEDDELRALAGDRAAEIEIEEYSWPIHPTAIKELWEKLPEGTNAAFQKPVRKYYNKTLEKAAGNYEDALLLMEEDEKVWNNYLEYRKKDKTLKKWNHRIAVCRLAQELLLNHPFLNDVNAMDPSFITEKQLELST